MKGFENKKISIIGAVRSGLAAAKLAKRNGIEVFVSEAAPYESLKSNFDELKRLNIEFEYGGNSDRVYDTDLIVTSPGVPSSSPVLEKAFDKNIPVISELEFAYRFCKGKIIGITGTNGKTTTTTLTAHTLKTSGLRVYSAGNIGSAFSEIADSVRESEFVVLEISSFQLDFAVSFAPYIALILNITPDHLDRYDNDIRKYAASKFNITKNQSANDFFLINSATAASFKFETSAKVMKIDTGARVENGAYFENGNLFYASAGSGEKVCGWSDVNLRGEHNLQNTLAVLAIAKILNCENRKIKDAFSSFEGVEHRLEFVRELNGVTFINDSKATNVDSVYYALQSFNYPLRLILGGKDKGNDYSKILDSVKKNVKKIYAIGSSKEKVYSFFGEYTETEMCASMEEAVKKAYAEAVKGDVVLLSPACASFDMFDNYEHRGEVFKNLANGL